MEERSRRIIEAAIELAEKGGFEAVRLRDVAAHADVALGTLYRRFRSKEDLLLAALDLLVIDHERLAAVELPDGGTPLERVVNFFETITEAICGRPNLARALVRSVASGAPGLTLKVSEFHTRVEDLIIAALRGAHDPRRGKPPEDSERRLAYTLLLVWFASLTGWASGLHDPTGIVEHTRIAAGLILRD